MPAIFLIASQQPTPHLPSRITPIQDSSSSQSAIIALIITGAITIGVISFIGYKKYQQYRFRQQVKTLERMWQKPYSKR